MKRLSTLLVLLLGLGAMAFGGPIEEIQSYLDSENYKEGLAYGESILDSVTDPEIRWKFLCKMSSIQMEVGDQLEREGAADKAELMAIFTKAQNYAKQSLEIKETSSGYFWYASNIGRWGETKGIFDALGKAPDMRDNLKKGIALNAEDPDNWFLLSKLYSALPGGLISFGNQNYAVSCDRMSVELYKENGTKEMNRSYCYQLAKNLYTRNWSVKKRNKNVPYMKDEWQSADNSFDKASFFEGTVDFSQPAFYTEKPLNEMSDREEAIVLMTKVKEYIESLPEQKESDKRAYAAVKEKLDLWT